jgi:UDP-2-acetamido-2,6-beta-L-arabino-hexul-4-ose reductase
MKVLVTGSKGFIGKNFLSVLSQYSGYEVLEFDLPNTLANLTQMAQQADVVFHLAGVNCPVDPQEYITGNINLTKILIQQLVDQQRIVPIVITSSVQAESDSLYGQSKRAAEQLVFDYSRQNNQPCYVFRLPNVFGKWSRPNYNSVVATFCYNLARGLPIEADQSDLKLVYIDDVVRAFMQILEGDFQIAADGYSYVGPVLNTSVQEVADIIGGYIDMRNNLQVPDYFDFLGKYLYSTLISFLPSSELSTQPEIHYDYRGSFMEVLRGICAGQVSINKTLPKQTKGNHWHKTLIERFCNVSGRILFRMRQIGKSEVTEILLDGDEPRVIEVPPGVVHNFTNIGDDEAITLIWASQMFDPEQMDVIYEDV